MVASSEASAPTTFEGNFALPWYTSGSDVVDAQGKAITLSGINWSGSLELMIPEGLQYASAGDIIAKIKGAGMNAVRHTFAIEMIDELITAGQDVTIFETATRALGQEDGARLAQKIVKNNAQYGWTFNTTRLQILDTIAQLEANAGILMHLDNHISVAKWCCSSNDGNGFFGDLSFDVDKWIRGLDYMARWAAQHSNVASLALRNELRRPKKANPDYPYGWDSWVKYMTKGADAVHAANPNLLILFSGLDSDTTLADVIYGKTQFDLQALPYANKVVFELHRYEVQNCDSTAYSLYYSGFSAMDIPQPHACNGKCPVAKIKAPVWLTEIGGNMQDGSVTNGVKCILQFCLTADPKKPISWFYWTLQGSYYLNQGKADAEEQWGLLTRDWSTYRNQTIMENFYKNWTAHTAPTSFESTTEQYLTI